MKEKKDMKDIYFIYSIEKNKKKEIISDYLEIIKTINLPNDKNNNLNINLYKISIEKAKLNNETKIKIKLIDNEGSKNIYEYLIDISENRRNIFLFENIEFKNVTNFIQLFSSNLPPQNNLTFEEKYEIFKNKNNEKNENEKEINDLIYFTQKLLEKENQYNFSFFVSVFNDININNIDTMEKHIELFDIKKTIFNKEKLSNKIDIKKIVFLIDNLSAKRINEDKAYHDLLFLLILMYKYHKSLIKKIFIDKFIRNIVLKILLEDKKKNNEQKLFAELILPCDIMESFMKIANNYKDILLIISYNNNFEESLIVLNHNLKFIKSNLIKEIEKIGFIKLDNYIKPDIKDDLANIKYQLGKLLLSEKNMGINVVQIYPELLNKYLIFHEKNSDKCICLYQIVKIIEAYKDKGQIIYTKIKEKIYNTLEIHAMEGNLDNMNLLYFIRNLPISKKGLDKKILKNIKIEKINEEFIIKFKEINWTALLNISELEFIIKICDLITNMKYFGKIFLLFDFFNEINKIEMNIIKDKFVDLLGNFNEKDNPNIINDCSKLIYFLNIKKCEMKIFFRDYFYKQLSQNYIHQIYCDICSRTEYNIFNDEFINLVYEYYNKEENQNLNKSIYLAFEIEYNENFKSEDLECYYFNQQDFYDLNKDDKFNLLERIMLKQLLNKKCLKEYLSNNTRVALKIIKEIKERNINYKNINIFFMNNNKEELKRRIKIFLQFVDKYEDNKNLFNEIEQKFNDIKKTIQDLKIVENKLNFYFKEKRKDDIKEIQDLIIKIENNLEFFFENKNKINKILEQKEIEELPLDFEKSNYFFKNIYEDVKQESKDESEIINKTKKRLNKIINSLNSNFFNNETLNDVNKIMDELNEEQFKNLSEEIKNLLPLKKKKNKTELIKESELESENEKKVDILKCIWKMKLVYNFSIIFKLLLEEIKVKQTEFTSINNIIYKYLEKPKNNNIIKACIELYKNYNITFIEDNYFEFFKFIKSNNNINEIINFLFSIDANDLENKINILDENNYNDFDYVKNYFEKIITFKSFLDNIFLTITKDTKDIDIIQNFLNGLYNIEEYREDFITILINFSSIKEIIEIIDNL